MTWCGASDRAAREREEREVVVIPMLVGWGRAAHNLKERREGGRTAARRAVRVRRMRCLMDTWFVGAL